MGGEGWAWLVATAALLLAVVAASTLPREVVVGFATSPADMTSPPPSSRSTVPPPPRGALPCNPATRTPSAILIPTEGPGRPVPAGGEVRVDVRVSVPRFAGDWGSLSIDVPSLLASLPTTNGSPVTLYFAPAAESIGGPGELNGSVRSAAIHPAGSVPWDASARAVLSSQKLAVMANAPYGSLWVEIQWRWSLGFPNGTDSVGSWTSGSNQSSWPDALASIFEPAPYARILSQNGPALSIGDRFVATLGEAVAGRYFFLELEWASNGTVVQAEGQTPPAGVSTANVTIALLNYDHFLDPGAYLVHIHDACGAMLHSIALRLAFAPTATVGVSTIPTGCGGITVNGTGIGSGESVTVRPSATPYSYALQGCAGHRFHGWSVTGGLHFVSGNGLRVSSSGTIAIEYR